MKAATVVSKRARVVERSILGDKREWAFND